MKIEHSPETLRTLRQVLESPTLMGSRAQTASELEIYEYGEAFIDKLADAASTIAEAGRQVGMAWGKAAQALADLGRSLPPA